MENTRGKLHLLRFAVKTKSMLREMSNTLKYHRRLRSGKTVVTIFGSCRQDSLYETFAVTRIRERLTYCHYIEEVIQAALYCKDKEKSVSQFGAFRVDLLGKPRLNRKALQRDFFATEVFVIEIASLLEYSHERTYFHHEAFDSPVVSSNFENRGILIKRSRGNIEEIQSKLDRLFCVLPREQTVLVSHIATRPDSDRWKLNNAVRKYASEHSIEYFDPSDILEIWPLEKICKIEPVISHFTPMGHEIVRDRLSQCIYRVKHSLNQKRSKVVHVYPSSENSIGFGDFVLGSIFLKQIASKKELPIEFNLNGHPLGGLLEVSNELVNSQEIINLYHDDPTNNFKGPGFYVSNRRPNKIDTGDRDFILRNLLRFSEPNAHLLESVADHVLASSDSFTVFHVRMGDKISFERNGVDETSFHLFSSTLREISKILEYFPVTSNYIILSDSLEFKEYARDNGFSTLLSNTTHFNSLRDASSQDLLSMLSEYKLLLKSSRIIQFSVYSWGSGFSDSAAAIGGAELIRFSIHSKS